MHEQINRIIEKIGQIKNLDKDFKLFGSLNHKYKINPTISIDKIKQFEQEHNVTLPKEYVEFITKIGNGGVGPFYGLEPFENCLYDDLDYKRSDSLLNPSKPFSHTLAWNMEFETKVDEDKNEKEYQNELSKFEEQYFNKELMNGVIAICNFGCGVNMYLVVNGQEYGNIWTDDRGSDNGIYPSIELGNKDKITFLNWYELWLDNSLNEIAKFPTYLDKQDTKPWWKIW